MPETTRVHLTSSVDEDPFASPPPVSLESAGRTRASPEISSDPGTSRNTGSKQHAEPSSDTLLLRELETLRSMNQVIESAVASLRRARGNMDTVSGTVNSASTLLNTWTRILSQTEHNQRLILDPNWKGASADILEAENESLKKAQAQERRRVEDERRSEEVKKRAEDEERQRQAGTTTVRGARGSTSRLRGSRGGHSTGASSNSKTVGRGSQTIHSGTGSRRGLGGSRGRSRDAR
ncbi:hypothetical protein K3495_g3730 [Podosphaera aphanis]|nr:hypothetical protein K3495_g3730 [Podosphaera aphanis]